MLARTHFSAAILFALILHPDQLLPSDTLLYYSFVIFTCLLTDLDHPNSTFGHTFPLTSWITHKLLGHRGLLHGIWVPLGVWLTTRALGYPLIGTATLVGMTSHLACDILTKNGLRPLHPLTNIHFKGFITTGGVMERIFFWILNLIILWKLLQH